MTDFGAEESFGGAAARVKEHYGIEVSPAAIRRSVYQHGRSIGKIEPLTPKFEVAQLITELDGSMVPIVEPGRGTDARKGKTLLWREARLCCARGAGTVQPVYGATFGSTEVAACVWLYTAQRAGLTPGTYVHGLGDGAPWIMERFKNNFGTQGNYLLDFYHVSEYLAAASLAICGQKKACRWRQCQQGRLLTNRSHQVLKTLEKHLEPEAAQEAPVRAAHRYIQERQKSLDYKGAQERNLPIGSGEIESAHRHVIQKRMKLAGSWWKETNAEIMLRLRVARANNLWDAYWAQN
jgi:hypothetical protein